MKEFKPTYLMIKRHSVTGLLYLCKTTKNYEEMLRYKGSGKPYWNNHLKEHGKKFVETPWFELFTEKDELVKFALMLSEQMDIVKGKDANGKKIWANLKPENGINGGSNGPCSEEQKAKTSAKNKGKPSPFRGIVRGPQSEEHRNNIAAAKKGSTQSPDTIAKKVFKTTGQKRTEEACKNISDSLLNKPKSPEHIANRVSSMKRNGNGGNGGANKGKKYSPRKIKEKIKFTHS